MRNNTLHITYNPIIKVSTTMDISLVDSFRCTSLNGAKKAFGKRNMKNIDAAIFTDKHGVETKVK